MTKYRANTIVVWLMSMSKDLPWNSVPNFK